MQKLSLSAKCLENPIIRGSLSKTVFKIGVHKNFPNFTGKQLSSSLFLIKLQTWTCNFIKRWLQHKCVPVKFVTFLITPILKNISEQLLLTSSFVFEGIGTISSQFIYEKFLSVKKAPKCKTNDFHHPRNFWARKKLLLFVV